MRLLVITHSSHTQRKSSRELFAGLEETTDLSVADWDQMDERSIRAAGDVAQVDLVDVDACMVYVRFRYFELEPFDWSGFEGRRVIFEPDAWFGFSPAHPAWHGRFAAVYRRDGFHLMISTGKNTTAGLRAEGVHATWMPKAYDSASFSDLGRARSGVCTFGTVWPTRRALIAQLGDLVTDVSGPYATQNARLNGYEGAVVCNMPGTTPLGKAGRAIRRWRPGFVRPWPAVEPMIKTFETAGAGCAPIVDHIDELADLGFVNGRTCLTYRTFDEAVSAVRQAEPGQLRAIGQAAADLARSRHTWRHRAAQLPQLIESG